MLVSRFNRLSLRIMLFASWNVVMLIAFFAPSSSVATLATIPYLDKIAHITLFGGYMFISLLLFRHSRQLNRTLIFWLLGIGAIYGAMIEWLQSLVVPTRMGDWGDWIADVIGLLLGLVVYYLFHRFIYTMKRREHKH